MAEKKAALPPPTEPFPGSRTPGWNDPPTLQYDPLSPANAAGRTRLSLNKRVAFPLQQGSSVANQTKPTAIVPPNRPAPVSGHGASGLPPPPPLSMPPVTQPIAVVHPMQSTTIAATGVIPHPPLPTTTTNLPRIPVHSLHSAEEAAAAAAAPASLAAPDNNSPTTAAAAAGAAVRTMFVPAMPRQDARDDAGACSQQVQHI